MKKIVSNLLYISILLLIIATATSCRRDLPNNYFIVDGEVYEVNAGFLVNNGETQGGFDLDLQLISGDGSNYINFSIVSPQAEKLINKTYNNPSGFWVVGYQSNGKYKSMAQINKGYIVVDRKSDGYVININCTDQYGNEIEGYYKGRLSNTDKNNIVHAIPDYVIPEEIYSDVEEYFPIYFGTDIPDIDGEYLSSPHVLVYQSDSETPDSIVYFSDCYVGFMYRNNQMSFFKKQFDTEQGKDIEEIYYNVKISGDDNYFTCYYVIDGYPDGYYAQQSFLFSGRKTDQGIEDFHTAVILLETSGHPYLPAKNTFRVLKDQDGMAYMNNWMTKSPAPKRGSTNNDADSFRMWMK